VLVPLTTVGAVACGRPTLYAIYIYIYKILTLLLSCLANMMTRKINKKNVKKMLEKYKKKMYVLFFIINIGTVILVSMFHVFLLSYFLASILFWCVRRLASEVD
jgi:uncharacterized membrane protein